MIVENPVQDHKIIELDDLILWAENPREPVEENTVEEIIIGMALNDKRKKWNLEKLLAEMGTHYDESDLPTVVERDGKYIVYDGNRRIALIKFLTNPAAFPDVNFPFEQSKVPENIKNTSELRCNVCDEKTALYNVRRKNIRTGSWDALERDIFSHKHMRGEKSNFLIFEEMTGLIDENEKLNQDFVKREILTEANMNAIGFSFNEGKLQSVYNNQYAKLILHLLAWAIKEDKITTRKRLDLKKGETLKDRLEKEVSLLKGKLKTFNSNESDLKEYVNEPIGEIDVSREAERALLGEDTDLPTSEPTPLISKSTPPTNIPAIRMFPNDLKLQKSYVHDIYLDILAIDKIYHKSKATQNFPRILRFSLRLLVEVATDFQGTSKFGEYINKNFDNARENLSSDDKNTLSEYEVKKKNLARLLQIGAHNFATTTFYGKACAMSIIIGAMLEITHGKDKP